MEKFSHQRDIQRKISLLGLTFIGNHFEAFGRGQVCYPFHVANELNIKLVMYGENGELEYGGSLKIKINTDNPLKIGMNYITKEQTQKIF